VQSPRAAICGVATHSFEPDPIIYGVLKRNVEKNAEYSKLIHFNHSAISIQQLFWWVCAYTKSPNSNSTLHSATETVVFSHKTDFAIAP
jgi:hypothetical protein